MYEVCGEIVGASNPTKISTIGSDRILLLPLSNHEL